MKKNTDHVVMDARTNAFTCTHCGQSYQPTMPAPIDMFVAMSNQFVITHGDCKPPLTIRHLPADDSEGGLP
jgi:hypothetical protein